MRLRQAMLCQALETQSMTWGPGPTCHRERVTSRSNTRWSLNRHCMPTTHARGTCNCSLRELRPRESQLIRLHNRQKPMSAQEYYYAWGPQVRDGQGKTSWQPDEREKLGSFPQYAPCPHCQDCSQEERMYDMILAPPAGSNHPRGGPGGHCRYLR